MSATNPGAFAACCSSLTLLVSVALAQQPADALTIAIMEMLGDAQDFTNGTANVLGERYGFAVEVQDTGEKGETPEQQLGRSAATALKIGTWCCGKDLSRPASIC